jgi:hypothetical protein
MSGHYRHRSSIDYRQTRYSNSTAREGVIHEVRSEDGIRGAPLHFGGSFRDIDSVVAPTENSGHSSPILLTSSSWDSTSCEPPLQQWT